MQSVKDILRALYAEENMMNNLVTVNFNQGVLDFPERKEILLMGRCRAIMPLNMVGEGSAAFGIYNTSGYRRISSGDIFTAWEVIQIAEKTLECIEICRDYLIFPDEYVLSADTVYVSPDLKEIKLVYIPDDRTCGENTVVSAFVYSLKKYTTDNGRTYLDTLGKLLESQNLKYSRVIGFAEELKREIRLYEIL